MRYTVRLLQHTAHITLFTRSNCCLCDSAKSVLRKLEEKRSFDLNEINVMDSNQKKWKELYEYDTPVVSVLLVEKLLALLSLTESSFISREWFTRTPTLMLLQKLESWCIASPKKRLNSLLMKLKDIHKSIFATILTLQHQGEKETLWSLLCGHHRPYGPVVFADPDIAPLATFNAEWA